MTWKEFKAEVDRQLKDLEVSEDVEIWWIDVHPGVDGTPDVDVNKTNGMYVS